MYTANKKDQPNAEEATDEGSEAGIVTTDRAPSPTHCFIVLNFHV